MRGRGAGRGARRVVASLLVALAACRAPLDREAAPGSAPAGLPEPGPPSGPAAREAFFGGLADAQGPLARLRAVATGPGAPPVLRSLPDVEAAVRWRFRRGAPGGVLREAMALGVSAASPLPPREMADLLGNAQAERIAFGATTFRPLGGGFRTAVALRRTYEIEMLDVGEGPVRFDFRFRAALERWDLADGSVLLRYDPVPWAGTTHVTLFRGLARLEPAPGGCVVTELLLFGSDVRVPFFLRGLLRQKAADTFRARIGRLWELASGLARR